MQKKNLKMICFAREQQPGSDSKGKWSGWVNSPGLCHWLPFPPPDTTETLFLQNSVKSPLHCQFNSKGLSCLGVVLQTSAAIMVLCVSVGAGSCSNDLCFMDLFLAVGPQGEGVGISYVYPCAYIEISLVEVRKCVCVWFSSCLNLQLILGEEKLYLKGTFLCPSLCWKGAVFPIIFQES